MYGKSLHLIISDIMMPETDGYEFAKTVRSLNENILILFMTARDDFASKQKGYRIGIDDYMVKPMDLDERTAVYDGENIAITTREFNILYKLLSHPGKAFTRTQLMDSEDTPERLILQTECPGIGQGLEEQITSFLYNHSDTGLVVIDTLQEAPTENGGRVAECRPAPGRPGGTTATTAEPKAEAASPQGRQTKNSHCFPAVARDSDRPGRAGDGRTPKKNWA